MAACQRCTTPSGRAARSRARAGQLYDAACALAGRTRRRCRSAQGPRAGGSRARRRLRARRLELFTSLLPGTVAGNLVLTLRRAAASTWRRYRAAAGAAFDGGSSAAASRPWLRFADYSEAGAGLFDHRARAGPAGASRALDALLARKPAGRRSLTTRAC